MFLLQVFNNELVTSWIYKFVIYTCGIAALIFRQSLTWWALEHSLCKHS